MNTATALTRLLVVLPLVCLTATAHAQWQWIDSSGRKVFSDTAPPPGTPDKNILRRPSGVVAPPVATSVPVPSAAPAASPAAGAPTGTPKPEGVDPRLEARKREAEAAEAAKKKAEEERYARQRAENCERARNYRTTLDSGVRIASTGPSGERIIMDDAARAAERQRTEEAIRNECGPAPRPAQ